MSLPQSAACWLNVVLLGVAGLATAETRSQAASPIVIAHRGASGYLPEHTEGAKVLAVAQGADYVEQDVVLSRDGVCVVSHDITMQGTTDVARVFPGRARPDGKYYFVDFDWAEIQQVSVLERGHKGGAETAASKMQRRFPGGFHQRVMRLEDEIDLVKGLEVTLERPIGLYVELKQPQWHRSQGNRDLTLEVLGVLQRAGFDSADDRCYIQCFEASPLERLHGELKCPLKLVQLMSGGGRDQKIPSGIDNWRTRLKEVARYAQGVGPAIDMLFEVQGATARSSGLVEAAHEVGLAVHPYTVRRDALPAWTSSIDELHRRLLSELKVDGFFTDFPDLGRRAVDGLVAPTQP